MLSVLIIVAFCLMVLAPCVVALRGSRLMELGEYDTPVAVLRAKQAALATGTAVTLPLPEQEATVPHESPDRDMQDREFLLESLEHEMLRAEAAMVAARALMAEAEAAGYEAAAQIAAVRSKMAMARAEEARREASEAEAAAKTADATVATAKEAAKPAVPAAA